ncbi:hypothetical protein N9891_00100 [bacterium]|nr:hypothetical protein [bacterium]
MNAQLEMTLDRDFHALKKPYQLAVIWIFLPKWAQRIFNIPSLTNTKEVKRVTQRLMLFLEDDEMQEWASKHTAVFEDDVLAKLKLLINKEKNLLMKPLFAMAGLRNEGWIKSREITRALAQSGVKTTNLGGALDDLAADRFIEIKTTRNGTKKNPERESKLLTDGFTAIRSKIDDLENKSMNAGMMEALRGLKAVENSPEKGD